MVALASIPAPRAGYRPCERSARSGAKVDEFLRCLDRPSKPTSQACSSRFPASASGTGVKGSSAVSTVPVRPQALECKRFGLAGHQSCAFDDGLQVAAALPSDAQFRHRVRQPRPQHRVAQSVQVLERFVDAPLQVRLGGNGSQSVHEQLVRQFSSGVCLREALSKVTTTAVFLPSD